MLKQPALLCRLFQHISIYVYSKLGEKYGKGNIVLSAISSVAEIGENSVKMHDVMVDENSNAYDKVGQAINVGGS